MTTDPSRSLLGDHAVIIGGSLGGLLSARMLSNYFGAVTVIERDVIPETHEPRKGVPQGRHIHTLYGGGGRVVERLLPGVFDEMRRDGAMNLDFSKDIVWYHQGVWKMRTDMGLPSIWGSRPFLEGHVRRRVQNDTPNARFLRQCEVTELLANSDRTRVTGVRVVHRTENDRVEDLAADLVLDAGGRASQTPTWLESLGYATPQTSTVEIDLAYASRLYERPPSNTRDWEVMGLFPTPPDRTRVGYIGPIEGNRWVVSAVGYLGDHPPDDDQGFLEFAKSMELPDFYDAIKDAKPLTPVSKFRFPAQIRRHYERLSRFPDGLLVLGDAISSFNPVYGQGMSVCALEVDLLDRMLSEQTAGPGGLTGFPRRFFKQAAKFLDNPWLLATNSDYLYPQTKGDRPFGTALLNWYVVQVFEMCSWNQRVAKTFLEVLHFIKQPIALFHPYILFHVLKWGLGLKGGRTLSKDRPRVMRS